MCQHKRILVNLIDTISPPPLRKFGSFQTNLQSDLRSLIFATLNSQFLVPFHCNYVSPLYRFQDVDTNSQNSKRSSDPKCITSAAFMLCTLKYCNITPTVTVCTSCLGRGATVLFIGPVFTVVISITDPVS